MKEVQKQAQDQVLELEKQLSSDQLEGIASEVVETEGEEEPTETTTTATAVTNTT